MSKATKRKHVTKEVADLSTPTESQSIVRIIDPRGNNLHEVEDSAGDQYLVSMPTKFRKNVWIKRGDYVLVEPILEGDKVKAEIVKILTREHQRFYRSQKCWPEKFDETTDSNLATAKSDKEDDLFVNTNRTSYKCDGIASDSGTSSDESNSS